MSVGVSKGTALDDRKAGAELEAGTAEDARDQAATGHIMDPDSLGTRSSTAPFEEHIVFEDFIRILRPSSQWRMSRRLRVWGPPHIPGRGESKFDCLRNAKYPINKAAIGMRVEEPSDERKPITACKAPGVKGGEGVTICDDSLSPPRASRLILGDEKTEAGPPCSSTQFLAPDSAFLTDAGDLSDLYRCVAYCRTSYSLGSRGSAECSIMKRTYREAWAERFL